MAEFTSTLTHFLTNQGVAHATVAGSANLEIQRGLKKGPAPPKN